MQVAHRTETTYHLGTSKRYRGQPKDAQNSRVILTALTFCVALAACGGGSGDAQTSPGGSASQDDAQPTPDTSSDSQRESKINSVQTIIDDMGLANDAALLGIPAFTWATHPNPAKLSMGADPRGCIAPAWWQNISAVWSEYKDCDWWTGYVQWFIVFEGVGNNADNVRVETRNPQSWYLSRASEQWKLIGEATNTNWYYASKTNIRWVPGLIDTYSGVDDSTVKRVDRNAQYTYHGVWPLGTIDISAIAADIAAVYTTVEARLVVDDQSLPDERNEAIWLLQSGADYYPDISAASSNAIPPGVGLSRSKRITSEWQSFNFATTDNARKNYQGPHHGLSLHQLFANPPPLR